MGEGFHGVLGVFQETASVSGVFEGGDFLAEFLGSFVVWKADQVLPSGLDNMGGKGVGEA